MNRACRPAPGSARLQTHPTGWARRSRHPAAKHSVVGRSAESISAIGVGSGSKPLFAGAAVRGTILGPFGRGRCLPVVRPSAPAAIPDPQRRMPACRSRSRPLPDLPGRADLYLPGAGRADRDLRAAGRVAGHDRHGHRSAATEADRRKSAARLSRARPSDVAAGWPSGCGSTCSCWWPKWPTRRARSTKRTGASTCG